MLELFTKLLVIIDPFAVVPIFVTLTMNQTADQRTSIARRAPLYATGILFLFAIFGSSVFRLFAVSMPSFQIAGGILLLLFGIEQLSANRERIKDEEEQESIEKDDISVFPLATPLLAGPGSISTVVLLTTMNKGWVAKLELFAAITLVMLVCWGFLTNAHKILKLLGHTGLNLLTRIMGVMLTAIAIQFILKGLSHVVDFITI